MEVSTSSLSGFPLLLSLDRFFQLAKGILIDQTDVSMKM